MLEAKVQVVFHTIGMDELGMCQRVVFERACSWVRHGVHPVFVMDGLSPAAKDRTLQRRHQERFGRDSSFKPSRELGNTSTGWFGTLCRETGRLLEAMGLHVIQAAGEADAMCAALNAAGLVNACASADVDVLLFGAEVSYKRMHLQADAPLNDELEFCELAQLRKSLGIRRGGTEALRAVGLLCGGDYASGASKVGHIKAFDAVRCLLSGAEDDSGLLTCLRQAVEKGPDPDLLSLDKCTGCKRCGHESGTKTTCRTHKKGCAECGTSEECHQRPKDACACKFHRLSLERNLAKVLEAASNTPGFLEAFDNAAEAYATGFREAAAAVSALQRQGFVGTWRRRPDLNAVAQILGNNVRWARSTVRSKLRPLLIQWDVCQGPNPQAAVEWRPLSITKVSTNANAPWRYIVQLQRNRGTGGSHEDEEADLAWLQGAEKASGQQTTDGAAGDDGDVEQQQGGDDGEDEQAQSQSTAAGAGASQQQTQQQKKPPAKKTKQQTTMLRISMMKQAWPDLVECFERAERDKAEAAAARVARKEAKARDKDPLVSAAQHNLMASVFKVVKNPPHRSEQAAASTCPKSSKPLDSHDDKAAPEHRVSSGRSRRKGGGSQQQQQKQQRQQQQQTRGPLDRFFMLGCSGGAEQSCTLGGAHAATQGLQRSGGHAHDEGLQRSSHAHDEGLQRSSSHSHDEGLHRSSSQAYDAGLHRSSSQAQDEGLHRSSHAHDEGLQRSSQAHDEGLRRSSSHAHDEGLQRSSSHAHDERLHRSSSQAHDEGQALQGQGPGGLDSHEGGRLTLAQRLQAKKQAWQRSLEQQIASSHSHADPGLDSEQQPHQQQEQQQQQQQHLSHLHQKSENQGQPEMCAGGSEQRCFSSPSAISSSRALQAHHPASPLSPSKRSPASLHSPSKRLAADNEEQPRGASSSSTVGSARACLFGSGDQEFSSGEARLAPPRHHFNRKHMLDKSEAAEVRGLQEQQGSQERAAPEVIVISDSD